MKFLSISKLLLAATVLVCSIGIVAVSIPDAVAKTASKKKTSAKKKSTSAHSGYTKYSGTIGTYKVTAFLKDDVQTGNVSGYYYYGSGSKGNLTLKGTLGDTCGPACVEYNLREYDKAGNVTGYWEVQNGGMTVNPGERVWYIMGTMTTAGGKSYEVELWQY